jgi:hypothetical protein
MSNGEPDSVVLICPHCDQPVKADIRGTVSWNGFLPGKHEPEGPPEEYRLLQCGHCHQPILQGGEDFAGEGVDFVVVYPPRRQLSWAIPPPLRRAWEEAQACHGAKAYTACAVMARRVVEGVCIENGVKMRSLAQGMRDLRDRGVIDGTLAEWADGLRLLGNMGAHYTADTVSRQDAEDGLAFAEALLDYLYVLKKRFADMQQRLAGKKQR